MDLKTEEVEIKNARWEDVEIAINRMDGEIRGETVLIYPKSRFSDLMVVGGGKDGLVTLSYFENEGEREATLMNSHPESRQYVMLIGNQHCEIDDEILVTKQSALIALRVFFEHHTLADELTWNNQEE